MEQGIREYINKSGLKGIPLLGGESFAEGLSKCLKEPNTDTAPLSYKVPKLSKGGTCSMGNQLEDKPYDLGQTLRNNGLNDDSAKELVSRIDIVAKYLHDTIKGDWTGIYKRLSTENGPALVKIAYRGSPSRAEFPLNAEFAKNSNNSTVGLSGKAVLVKSVRQHREEGQPYYECDNKVQSELCLPVFRGDQVVGIIDIESFQEDFFNSKNIEMAVAAAVVLSEIL